MCTSCVVPYGPGDCTRYDNPVVAPLTHGNLNISVFMKNDLDVAMLPRPRGASNFGFCITSIS